MRKDREDHREYCRLYHITHEKEEKEYYKLHRDEHLKRAKKYREENEDKLKKYRVEHRDNILKIRKRYYNRHKNEEEFREIRKMENYINNFNRKLKVIQLLGGKCVKCGSLNPLTLQVNHKNGCSRKLRAATEGHKLYRLIVKGKRSTDDLELRCANCNILYEYERKKRWCPPEYIHFYN